MAHTFSPIIDPQGLQVLAGSDELVILDASSRPEAYQKYQEEHLQGALFVNVETQLAGDKSDPAKGGRHPLPSLEDFGAALGQLGITPSSYVVIYDFVGGGNAAARMWWMLRAVGHERVQVLNGGLQHAASSGFPMASGIETPRPADSYPTAGWQWPMAAIDEVAAAAQDPAQTVIDVRSAPRYAGEVEPIDLIAGHIPGAINIPFEENLDEHGRFLSAEQLNEKYASLFADRSTDDVVVHCGSGVTACHTLLAMNYAGLGTPRLYVGSWSEWSRNDRPMITKS